MNFIKSIKNFTLTEKIIWVSSLVVIFISSIALPDNDWLSVITSLIGATALIFVSKGDPIGQLICIFFALCYAAVSLKFRYYGEILRTWECRLLRPCGRLFRDFVIRIPKGKLKLRK